MSMICKIVAFHEKFGLQYNGFPRPLPIEISVFRVGFMHEELKEYEEAVVAYNLSPNPKDLERQLDALVDLLYVLLGTAYLHGFARIWKTAFKRVHRANMKKVRAENSSESKRNSTQDVIKPEGWVAPDLSDLIR